jgi:hypothetical protein
MDSLEQRRSRQRSIVRDACVIVCFISVCAMLSLFNSYGRMTTVTEVCTESGAIREYEEYSLRGFVVARRHERVRTTGVSEFLLRHRVPGEHRWVFAESRQTDLSGRNVLEKAVGRDSFRLFAAYELKLTRESLGALYTHVPDLPEMIYRDILNEPNDGMAFGRVNALRQMCEHPDGLTRRLALHAWNVVLQADSAQTGAGPRNEETD